MAKTNAPASLTVGTRKISTNAKPDAYDLRDLEYRAMLQPLDPVVDARPKNGAFRVLMQHGQSCTGHAVAAVINTVLAQQADRLGTPPPGLVSPYMLYRLARRYDEFLGADDKGSSLRGAFKGWLRHGVALDREWKDLAKAEKVSQIKASPDLDNPAFISSCRERPLGAYYRVNAYRLDDMQSAIGELHAIAVSAAIHRGWEHPVPVTAPNGEPLMVIKRDTPADALGGHAFCIVGYNQLGFLVQNSWGTTWGHKGFATLLYDDWLASAYDAWVCRPGVPSTPLAAPSVTSRVTTSGDIVLSGGPNMTLLRGYVVNTGNDGRLSDSGKFASNPAQLDEMFANMELKHSAWAASDKTTHRHVVLYAHGGVIDEFRGLGTAQHQLGWWLQNHVYPISFCWESGILETIGNAIGDTIHRLIPFGVGFDFEEQADRLTEFGARRIAAGLWSQMKGNAIGASSTGGAGDIRGGTEIGRRLSNYIAKHPEATIHVHLAGHSAGTILLCALVERLTAFGIPIDSVAFMGGAATSALFAAKVLPAVLNGNVKRLTTFDLSEKMEQDDTCALGDKAWYHKSLLYLVARALEPNPPPSGVVPLVGLEVALGAVLPDGRTLGAAITSTTDACDGRIVIAPTPTTSSLRSDAHGHADFDNDSATMTSILLRILDVATPPAGPYRADLPVPDLPAGAPISAPAGMETQVLSATTVHEAPVPAPTAGTRSAIARKELRLPAILELPEIQIPSEAAISPKSISPAFDMLLANGYTWVDKLSGEAANGAGNGKGPKEPSPGASKPSKTTPRSPSRSK